MSLIEEWATAAENYRMIENEVETHSGRLIATGTDDRVTVYRGGDVVVQGEVLELESLDGTPTLIVEGRRYAWDAGPLEWAGKFAVMAYGDYPDIDGPLPEDSDD